MLIKKQTAEVCGCANKIKRKINFILRMKIFFKGKFKSYNASHYNTIKARFDFDSDVSRLNF